MSRHFPVIVKKWNWKFKLIFIQLCFLSLNGFGQISEKSFTQEIEVSESISILSNVPTSLDIELNTPSSHWSNTRDGYIIIGKNNKKRLFIHKEYAIHTWEKNIVRQEIDIKIKSESEAANKAFLSQLKIKLEENNQREVRVDANMNLAKFILNGHRFRSDDCHIILEDGTVFFVDFLEIKTRLYIPKTANLKVTSLLNHTLRLDDLEGDLDLDIQYGEVYGKKIKNLNANLRFCYNVIFEEAENVNASATNSHLKIHKVKNLRIGEIKLSKTLGDRNDPIQWMNNNSSMNIYNFREANKIVIADSANDKFDIGEVDELAINSSIFSTYQILKINKTFDLQARNSDVSISKVAKDFKVLNLKNTFCKMAINIAEEGTYRINIYNDKTVKYKLPHNAQLIKNESDEDAHFQMGKGKETGIINIHCDKCELHIWN